MGSVLIDSKQLQDRLKRLFNEIEEEMDYWEPAPYDFFEGVSESVYALVRNMIREQQEVSNAEI